MPISISLIGYSNKFIKQSNFFSFANYSSRFSVDYLLLKTVVSMYF